MEEKKQEKKAVLYSAVRPGEENWRQFQDFLKKKYGEEPALEWAEDKTLRSGFRLEAGNDVYDWSIENRLRQMQEVWQQIAEESEGNLIPLLQENVKSWTPTAEPVEVGRVLTVGDGIATVSGLPNAAYGEILLFSSGIRGMVQDLKRDYVGCILFGDESEITEGSSVKRTGRVAGMQVGEAFLGRVVNALGAPLDGMGKPEVTEVYPIERPAPAIIERQPVNKPMETGILAIDSMFPIGRGQRELIIGDRQTGKTAIALDTILNQRGKDVICIYVAIGQKASSVAALAETLRRHDALSYCVIVCATASDAAPLQYIAPYAGCSLGEFFMQKGKDVLIVYDDLSKHAIAYRALSLLLERSPGREAYPGDVFYLHSRLLERSAHLAEEKGGGSMTALPIVETQAGDVSAYIPTNIISITDGQIFLESDLFFAGQRPAVNVGLSVSRVGGDAQTKAMKKATGAIRLELAQYHEMEVFTQFASDLDGSTKRQLAFGQGLMMLLRQPQYHPWKQYEQVVLLTAAMSHVMESIPAKDIYRFAKGLLAFIEERADATCHDIEKTGLLPDEVKKDILRLAREYQKNWSEGTCQM